MTLDDRIRIELDRVKDPCSVASGRPTGLVEMGLVLGWEIEDRTLRVTFCVTFPGCTMAPHFIEAAREALEQFDEFDRVETRVDTDHIWRRPAGLRTVEMEGEPQAWRKRAAGVSQR
ncbi:Metal-sulfur cluster biosynthetic enzyme [Erythrobacter litoralis]|uniref:iron-sulfur cluster assembly protein n=1 Tax=Erythrobacter litoralis TaxID=39960 RepID=UPI00068EAEE3|nr:iron-sulfur cluster assembly protein [Erythrobacter litoralis]AOL23841.1 Metal-sulfur cluster biosynthetic enzyme [Erythrobacter litoralis]